MLNTNYRKLVGKTVGSTSVVDLCSSSCGCTKYTGPGLSIGTTSLNSSCWNTIKEPYSNNGATSYMSLIVGNGTTNATQDDIALENEIKDLTYITGSTMNGASDYLKLITVTYKNNTSDIVSVNEIGMVAQMANDRYCDGVLLGRVVLATPVIMNPGDIYTFTYVIE